MGVIVAASELDMSDRDHVGLRSIVIEAKGVDGKIMKLTYQRYDRGFSLTIPEMTSNALAAFIRVKGDDWMESYTVYGTRTN